MFTNAQKLAAVLNKWVQPAIQGLVGAKISQLPFLANVEAKIKSMGWVSPMWSLGKEVSPLLGGVSTSLIEPLLNRYLQGVPDDAIPNLAHSVVSDAIKNGGLELFEGNIVFEVEDLEELQNLLRYNLPIVESDSYQVITQKIEEDE